MPVVVMQGTPAASALGSADTSWKVSKACRTGLVSNVGDQQVLRIGTQGGTNRALAYCVELERWSESTLEPLG